MKNKVTVTRANRLNLVKYKDYAVLSNVSKYLIEADGTVAVVNNEGNAIYIEARRMYSHLWGTYDMVYPMDNFEDVAKWVANGRKLEDLQGDTKSEFVSASELNAAQIATVIDNKGFGRFKWGDVIMAVTGPDKPSPGGITSLVDGDSCPYTQNSFLTGIENIMVWPVRFDLGDTITFGKITE